ncbi:MAG: right-handed parallel beta-helix repeat-containing protein [Kiritimatiellae bacterium]|nr:right-handed parallel beta-helix repeat-containing protein [Kiritimatiellia bacterium]
MKEPAPRSRVRTVRAFWALWLAWAAAVQPARAATLRVGPGRTYTKPSQAAAAASNGDVIEIDAGLYAGDACSWYAHDLTIRGIGGMAHLRADGVHAQGKAIWVTKGTNTTVENIEFSGATVPDQNGAGIRAEGRDLTIRNCTFHDNENGILGGAGHVLIEFSHFASNGFGDGYTHNMYISNCDRFTLRHSYSHHAKVGHNVKSRAKENVILYNRLMDEQNGTSSYVLDMPNGGLSYVIGNLFQQGPNTQNSTMIAYGAEGLSNPNTELYVVNNTLVNDRGSGTFLSMRSGSTGLIMNNLFVGSGTLLSGPGTMQNNIHPSTPGLADQAGFDYRLTAGSPAVDAGLEPGSANGVSLAPTLQYVHAAATEARPAAGALDIGAYEFAPQGDTTPPQRPLELKVRSQP